MIFDLRVKLCGVYKIDLRYHEIIMFELWLRYYLLYYTFSFGIFLNCNIKKKKLKKTSKKLVFLLMKRAEIEESECFF